MPKFWTFVSLILVMAMVLLLASDRPEEEIVFSDLETECRYDRGTQFDISLSDDVIEFKGFFPVENTNALLDYSYSRSSERITLDVEAQERDRITDFAGNCLGSVVYSARTTELDPGFYTVELRHNGREIEKQVVEVK